MTPRTSLLPIPIRPALVLPLLLLLLTSCLPLPLGDSEHSKVDPHLAGFWNAATDAEKGMAALIAPVDSHCYMIQVANYTKTGDKYQAETLLFKAWLTDVKGSRFLTCQPAMYLADSRVSDKPVYLTYRITLAGDDLTAKMVNEDYPKFKDVHDSAALARVIEENLDDPAMYREKPLEFHRLNPKDEANKAILNLFGF